MLDHLLSFWLVIETSISGSAPPKGIPVQERNRLLSVQYGLEEVRRQVEKKIHDKSSFAVLKCSTHVPRILIL